MSRVRSGSSDGGEAGLSAARLTGWLSLAAAPTFAIMALVTGFLDGPMDICSVGPGASPLGGMALMYLLMSAFHTSPWLKLDACRRIFGRPP